MSGSFGGRRLHFVGIGGVGMSGLALVAHGLGALVTGSDNAPYSGPLLDLGIRPALGHDAVNVPDGAEVVYSSAIAADNPELAVAQKLLHRSDLLGEVTRMRPTIAVTGTHGKTTTSSMIVCALIACGADPSYLVGGAVRLTGSNAGWGAGEWLVVEADESDRSLLALSPTIAVLTNAELDHHSTYASRREVDQTFGEFLSLATDAAVVWDRPELLALAPEDLALYPFDAEPELTASGSRFKFGAVDVELTVPGVHNARNAAAALTAVALTGADRGCAAASLRDFQGAGRRFERLGETARGAFVVDDYAHHPTEVVATLDAARTLAPERVIAIFQPHLYSRTVHAAREFGAALARADEAIVLDIYPARERAQDFPGVTGLLVAQAAADAAAGRPVAWLPRADQALAYLEGRLGEGDLVLTLGAGDIDALGRALVGI